MPGLTIIQAWQADETPAWIATCLASVRGWAVLRGYRYTCTDRFFDVVPAALRARCGAETGPLTDVARTELMAAAHADGTDLAVWIDADVLVFDPANFAIDTSPGFFGIHRLAACRRRKETHPLPPTHPPAKHCRSPAAQRANRLQAPEKIKHRRNPASPFGL